MPSAVSSGRFVVHPAIPAKETCDPCLKATEAKKAEIVNDKFMKKSVKQQELQRKDSQLKRLYWKKGNTAERLKHLAYCPLTIHRIREQAQQERSGKPVSAATSSASSPDMIEEAGPTSHFKSARETYDYNEKRSKPRPSRASSRRSSSKVSYQEDLDEDAFEELIAVGEHAAYLQSKKDEEARLVRKKKLEEEEARKLAAKAAAPQEDEDEPDYTAFFSGAASRSASPV